MILIQFDCFTVLTQTRKETESAWVDNFVRCYSFRLNKIGQTGHQTPRMTAFPLNVDVCTVYSILTFLEAKARLYM